MDTPTLLHNTICDDEVSVNYNLHVDKVPPHSADTLPFPLTRCLNMYMSAVDNLNSIGCLVN